MKILLALMIVLIGPLSLITLQVSINNTVNMRPTEPGWVNITNVGWWDYQQLLQGLKKKSCGPIKNTAWFKIIFGMFKGHMPNSEKTVV